MQTGLLLLRALLFAALVVAVVARPTKHYATQPGNGTLIFFDDFTDFDLSVWKHEITASGGGNWEFEYYMNNRSNSYVSNGTLFIKPTLTANTYGANVMMSFDLNLWGGEPADVCTSNAFYGCERVGGGGGNIIPPIQSARIRTVNSFSFTYGTVEVRAKLPRGDWLWPAIWMLPTDNQYGNWPSSGEVDIVESRGNVNYPGGGSNTFGSTLHWGPHYPIDNYPMTHQAYTLPSGDFADDFHIFGFVWNETMILTYLDSPANIILEVPCNKESFWSKGGWTSPPFDNPWASRGNTAPFDKDFYIILEVAVGGTGGYWADGVGNKPWSNEDPNAVNAFWNSANQWYPTWKGEDAALQIDYVKVWQ